MQLSIYYIYNTTTFRIEWKYICTISQQNIYRNRIRGSAFQTLYVHIYTYSVLFMCKYIQYRVVMQLLSRFTSSRRFSLQAFRSPNGPSNPIYFPSNVTLAFLSFINPFLFNLPISLYVRLVENLQEISHSSEIRLVNIIQDIGRVQAAQQQTNKGLEIFVYSLPSAFLYFYT